MKRRDLLLVGGGVAAGVAVGVGGTMLRDMMNVPIAEPVSEDSDNEADATIDERLPAGARVMLMGDSIFAGSNFSIRSDSYFALTHNAMGELIWAYMMDPRFSYEIWEQTSDRGLDNVFWDGDNQGIVGSRSTRLADPKELAHIRQLDPDIVIVGFGANDIALGSSFTDFVNRIKAFCDQMIAVDGRRVIVALVRPHVVSGTGNELYDYEIDSNKWKVHFAINDYLRNDLTANYPPLSLGIWDTFTPLADPASYRGGEFVPAYTRDGVHLTDIGAFHSGRNLLPVLASMIQPGLSFDSNAENANLLPNGRMSGSSFRVSPGVSGELPEQWQVTRTSGDVATAFTLREHDEQFDGDKLVVVLDGNDAEEMQEFSIAFHEGRHLPLADASGKFVQLYIPVEIGAYPNLIGVTGFIADNDFRRIGEGLRSLDTRKSVWHGEAVSGWIITPRVELSEGSTGFRCGLTIRLTGGTGSCRVAIRPNVIVRVVADPRMRNGDSGGSL